MTHRTITATLAGITLLLAPTATHATDSIPVDNIADECWIDSDPTNPIAAGGFIIYDNTASEGAVGTHSIWGQACGPPLNATPIPNVCHINGSTDTIPEGQWEMKPAADVGTSAISGQWCGHVAVAVAAPPAPVQSLPATGVENWVLAAIAALFVALGGGVSLAARRR